VWFQVEDPGLVFGSWAEVLELGLFRVGLGLYGLGMLISIFHNQRPSVFKFLELSQCKEGCDRKGRPRPAIPIPFLRLLLASYSELGVATIRRNSCRKELTKSRKGGAGLPEGPGTREGEISS